MLQITQKDRESNFHYLSPPYMTTKSRESNFTLMSPPRKFDQLIPPMDQIISALNLGPNN